MISCTSPNLYFKSSYRIKCCIWNSQAFPLRSRLPALLKVYFSNNLLSVNVSRWTGIHQVTALSTCQAGTLSQRQMNGVVQQQGYRDIMYKGYQCKTVNHINFMSEGNPKKKKNDLQAHLCFKHFIIHLKPLSSVCQ